MIQRQRKLLTGAACLALAGCAGMSQTQLALSKFDDGAHSVSTAQMSFFRGAQSAECKTLFYSDAYDYATGAKPTINLAATCMPKVLTSAQLVIRQNLMDSVTLYADQIQALAAAGDDKNLDSNGQALAGKINSLAKSQGFSASGLGIASAVETAIISITDLIIDRAKLNEIKAAATSKDADLKLVVGELKKENTELAAAIDSNAGVVNAEVTTMVAAAHQKAMSSSTFFTVIQAHSLVQNPLNLGAAASADPNAPTTNVDQLNGALDGIVKANEAIATASTGGLVAAVSDLVARAQQAQSIQAALNK